METNAAKTMVLWMSRPATNSAALLIAWDTGKSGAHARPHVVVASRQRNSSSTSLLSMEARNVSMRRVAQTLLNAMKAHAPFIAKVNGQASVGAQPSVVRTEMLVSGRPFSRKIQARSMEETNASMMSQCRPQSTARNSRPRPARLPLKCAPNVRASGVHGPPARRTVVEAR